MSDPIIALPLESGQEGDDPDGRSADESRAEALLVSLARILRRVSEPGGRGQIFEQILEDTIEISDSEYGYIGEVCRDGAGEPYVRIIAALDATGLEGRDTFFERAAQGGLEFREFDTPIGEMVVTEDPVIVNGALVGSSAAALPPGHPEVESFLAVPLHHAGSLVGVLGVANRPGGYTTELVEELEPLQMTTASLLRSRLAERALRRRQAALERMNLELQAKNEEVRRMYHTLCHELKTPLTSVREFASLVRDGLAGPVTSDQADYLDEALHACDDLTRHVNDLVDMTRMETGKLSCERRPTELGQVVRRCVLAYRGEARVRGVELACAVDEGLPSSSIDETRISQVVSNLVQNALKFTPEGGRVDVHVGRWELDPDWLEVSVSDTGRGIAADKIGKIFDRLYQVAESDWSTHGGLGLGLHLSREIIRMHGGRIGCESTPGEGSRFAFTLPSSEVLLIHAGSGRSAG